MYLAREKELALEQKKKEGSFILSSLVKPVITFGFSEVTSKESSMELIRGNHYELSAAKLGITGSAAGIRALNRVQKYDDFVSLVENV